MLFMRYRHIKKIVVSYSCIEKILIELSRLCNSFKNTIVVLSGYSYCSMKDSCHRFSFGNHIVGVDGQRAYLMTCGCSHLQTALLKKF